MYHSKWAAKRLSKFKVLREAVRHFWPGGYPVQLIQVAGTSGKGSTCHFIQAGLSEYGRGACYVKPHVFDMRERFVVQNENVSRAEIARTWDQDVKDYCVESSLKGEAWTLDHTEVSLLVALHIFARSRVEWAAVETIVGGRFDPVTALEVKGTVLTNVGRDHEEVLGSEVWQRALEKAGICRPGVPLFTSETDQVTLEVLESVCRDVGAPLKRVTEAEVQELRRSLPEGQKDHDEESLLSSEHQLWNAALAAAVVRSFVKKSSIERLAGAFSKTRFVGRFWKVEEGVYADVAHNPSKTAALANEILARFPKARKVFVIGISGVRDPVAVTGPLVPQARAIIVTSAGYKGQDPQEVYRRIRSAFPSLDVSVERDPKATLALAKKLKKAGEPVIFTGSTYMVDQALNKDERMRHLNGTYGWRDQLER
jgi:dihydrofolate synthase / folylpolyglutamate synthase